MPDALSDRLDAAVEAIPRAYPGPGGAVAVLREGEVLVRHAWGWANAERRIPFTPRTLFRMCSITKQFTCAVVLDASQILRRWTAMCAPACRSWKEPAPGALHLCPQPVGPARLLGGGHAAGLAGRSAVRRHRGRARSSPPRGRCSSRRGRVFPTCNQNFRMLGDIVAERPAVRFADCCGPASSTAPAWRAPSWPPTPAPCRTGPRAMKAPRPAVSARPRTASCGPATPAWAPAWTT